MPSTRINGETGKREVVECAPKHLTRTERRAEAERLAEAERSTDAEADDVVKTDGAGMEEPAPSLTEPTTVPEPSVPLGTSSRRASRRPSRKATGEVADDGADDTGRPTSGESPTDTTNEG